MRPLRLLTLAVGLLTGAAAAQPAPDGARLVEAWARGQREARRAAGDVRFTERAAREVEGPSVARTVRSETEVTLGPDGPRRRVLRAEVDGQEVRPARLDQVERRMAQAVGPVALWGQRPPLPVLLEELEPEGPARAADVDGRPAWLVGARSRGGGPRRGGPPRERGRGARPPEGPPADGRATLWFTRGAGPPRLLRARFERPLPEGGSATLDAAFDAVGALDLPARHHAEAVVRQRRRLRLFTVLIRTDVEYGDYRLGR